MLPECPFAALPVRSGFRPGREGSERGRIGREEERRKEEGGAKQREADVDADGRTDGRTHIWPFGANGTFVRLVFSSHRNERLRLNLSGAALL